MAQNFYPDFGALKTLNATTSSSSVNWVAGTPANSNAPFSPDLYVYNAGAGLAFIRWGVGAQTALVTDIPIPPGTVQVFSKFNADTVAAICASGTATVYVITGQGV